MKLRITPLNIIGAIGLGLAAFTILSPKDHAPRHVDFSGFYLLILGCLILVTFITDLIFRFTLKDLKKIWGTSVKSLNLNLEYAKLSKSIA